MKKIRPEIFSSYRFRDLVEEYVQGEINRKILILFYAEDLTQEEVAEKLNVSVATVKRACAKYAMRIFLMMGKSEP